MGALFDLSFKRYIAPTIAKIVYVLAMIGIAITYLIFVVSAFDTNAAFGLLVLIILGPLAALLYLVFIRVLIESLLATIQTAQNTSELVRIQSGGAPPQPEQGSPTPPDETGTGEGPVNPPPSTP